MQKEKELDIQKLKNESDQKLGRGQLVFTNIKQLNSNNKDDKQLAMSALIWTLGHKEAGKLFSSLQLFGPTNIQAVAGSARIKIQNANLTKESNIRAWNGSWVYIFTSSLGQFTGPMTLRTNNSDIVSNIVLGEFSIKDKSIKGSLEGSLSDDGTILSGSWRNSRSQNGSFYFELTRRDDSLAFEGNYSMSDVFPKKNSVLTWTGIKNVE